MITSPLDIATAVLLIVGTFFMLVGAIGLVRMPAGAGWGAPRAVLSGREPSARGTLLILPTGQPGFVCTADCADGKPVECGGPDACPNGQICCGAVEGGTLLSPARLTSTACASECPDGVVLCRSDADCGGGSCTKTSLLEGFSTCE